MDFTSEFARALVEHHPLETARVLERATPEEAWQALHVWQPEIQLEVLQALTPDFAARLLLEADAESRRTLIRELPSEASTDILEELPANERERLIEQLPRLHAEELAELARYPEDSAGSVMSPEVVALRIGMRVGDALQRLRRLALVGRPATYIYVVDEHEVLHGVLLMRDLVLSPPERPLLEIMRTEVSRVETEDLLSEVADRLRDLGLLALPVVDREGRLKGVIDANQLVSELQEEGFEDAQKMFGAGSDEHASSTAGYAIRRRLPWLQVNLLTAFAAAVVIGAFDGLIAQLTVLAAFLPVVAGQAGNAGAQALAVMLRALALSEIDPRAPGRVLAKEARVGLVNGLATGASAGLVAALATGNAALGVVISTAMTLTLVLAGVAGAGIPLLLARLGQDPAQSANIVLTTVTDVAGFAAFLGLALLARGWLVG